MVQRLLNQVPINNIISQNVNKYDGPSAAQLRVASGTWTTMNHPSAETLRGRWRTRWSWLTMRLRTTRAGVDQQRQGRARGRRPRSRLRTEAQASKHKVVEFFDLRRDRCFLVTSTESASSTLTRTTTTTTIGRRLGQASQMSAERSSTERSGQTHSLTRVRAAPLSPVIER